MAGVSSPVRSRIVGGVRARTGAARAARGGGVLVGGSGLIAPEGAAVRSGAEPAGAPPTLAARRGRLAVGAAISPEVAARRADSQAPCTDKWGSTECASAPARPRLLKAPESMGGRAGSAAAEEGWEGSAARRAPGGLASRGSRELGAKNPKRTYCVYKPVWYNENNVCIHT